MTELSLHGFHQLLGARFSTVGAAEVVNDYGEAAAEHRALTRTAGVLDLSFRSRLCLTGADRARFLHGQVTNQVQELTPGQGCYAALVTAKGKLVSDLNIFCLPEELLLDFEPCLSGTVTKRFEQYIIADDVQVVDVSPHYGLLSIQGPLSAAVLDGLELGAPLPRERLHSVAIHHETLGELHCANQPRGRQAGFDLFVPQPALASILDRLVQSARAHDSRPCGWQALEMIRIEAGQPRFGADMDETHLAPEAGLADRAISYSKGCYIGQEVIARIRTYGQVNKELRGLLLPDDLPELPARGAKLRQADREVGFVTSALASPAFRRNVALGYVHRSCNEPGTELQLVTAQGPRKVQVVRLPFDLAVAEP
ncbi:MAG TPA: glycine cleavage T C-terminal barrel domain-containing protein [Candidatus Saccharimonadales bacterium]|nr:glycine cleavage T C-terminal barrel domain-containing protein [Candidatus Saccharimonadales bacterium]